MRQQPGSVICQPVPHSTPARSQLERLWPCCQTGRRSVPSGAVAEVSVVPAVLFSTSFNSSPTMPAKLASLSLVRVPWKKSAQRCPPTAVPNASGNPSRPGVSGDAGSQPARPNRAPEGCGAGKATRTRMILDTRPKCSVQRPSTEKRNSPRHALTWRRKLIEYWLPLGDTATTRLHDPTPATETATRSPTCGTFKLTLITGVPAGTAVAGIASAPVASSTRMLVQHLTAPL
jgi:hypothetical protein